MIKFEKKSNAVYILTMIIITLVSFFVYLSFFTSLMPNAVSSTDDISCRTYLAMKSFPGVGIGEFFYNINQKCRVDEDIKIDLSNKDESFEEIAVEMSKCWYRYGDGELDFLSSWDTSGNWCFLCGAIKLEDNANSLMFTEFISWSKENEFNESLSFYEYIGMRHTDIDDVKYEKIREDYLALVTDTEITGEYKDLIMVLSNQITDLTELKNKKINSFDEKVYVVYRYDRVDKEFVEKLEDAGNNALKGAIGGLVISMLAEGLAEAAIGGTIGAVGGTIAMPVVGTVTGGLFGIATGFFSGIIKAGVTTVKAVDKVTRITKMMKTISSYVKNSKFLVKHGDELLEHGDELLEAEQLIVNGIKVEVKLSKRITDFEATPKDMKDFANLVSKDHPEMGRAFDGISEIMDELKVDNFNGIDKRIIDLRANKELLNKLETSIKDIDPKKLEDLAKQNGVMANEIENLGALRNLAFDEISKMKSVDLDLIDEVPGIKNYLRAATVIVPAVVGGVIGAKLNDNYRQYVDLLTREQYYRLCGTERGNFG